MREKSEVGRIGEDIACEYLKDHGYRIVLCNVKHTWGEIDVIAKDRQGLLVFVEVKTLQGERETFSPEGHFNYSKAEKTKRAAQLFAGDPRNEKLINNLGWRIDLIAIRFLNPLLTDYKKDCDIKHFENVIA